MLCVKKDVVESLFMLQAFEVKSGGDESNGVR